MCTYAVHSRLACLSKAADSAVQSRALLWSLEAPPGLLCLAGPKWGMTDPATQGQ